MIDTWRVSTCLGKFRIATPNYICSYLTFPIGCASSIYRTDHLHLFMNIWDADNIPKLIQYTQRSATEYAERRYAAKSQCAEHIHPPVTLRITSCCFCIAIASAQKCLHSGEITRKCKRCACVRKSAIQISVSVRTHIMNKSNVFIFKRSAVFCVHLTRLANARWNCGGHLWCYSG